MVRVLPEKVLPQFAHAHLWRPCSFPNFRKRFPVEFIAKVNEYVCTGAWPEQQRNVDRNDPQDNHPNPPDTNVQEKSAQSGKKNKNTSKKKLKKEKKQKKNRGKLKTLIASSLSLIRRLI